MKLNFKVRDLITTNVNGIFECVEIKRRWIDNNKDVVISETKPKGNFSELTEIISAVKVFETDGTEIKRPALTYGVYDYDSLDCNLFKKHVSELEKRVDIYNKILKEWKHTDITKEKDFQK